MKIAFVGDISLNGSYCEPQNIGKDQDIFAEVKCFFNKEGIDILVGNLESPLKKGESENLLKEPRVYTKASAVATLTTLAPAVFSLANNHIYDCLEDGFLYTKNWLDEMGLGYLGAGSNFEEAIKPFRFQKNGSNISIFSYVAEDTNPSLPEGSGVCLNFLEKERAIREIQEEAKNAFVIVLLHWGEEFSHYPTPEQREIARSFVDEGASLVVGHHAHAVEPKVRRLGP